MDTIEKQKALANRVYYILGDSYNILLAGGAPRDWHIGELGKDLDFYIQTDNPEAAAEEVSNQLNIQLKPLGDDKYNGLLKKEPSLLSVYEGEMLGQAVQFMFTSVSPKEFVNRCFDLSICKVWYENGEIGMDWEARLSLREKLVIMKGWTEHGAKIADRDEWTGFAWLPDWNSALRHMEARGKGEPGMVFIDDLPENEVDF